MEEFLKFRRFKRECVKIQGGHGHLLPPFLADAHGYHVTDFPTVKFGKWSKRSLAWIIYLLFINLIVTKRIPTAIEIVNTK